MIKIPGVPTGTVDAVTQSGQRARWKPHGDLTLIVSETASQVLPSEIKANPDKATAIKMMSDRERRMSRSLLGRFLDWVFHRGEFPPVRESARIFVGHNVGNEEFWRAGQVYFSGYILREDQLKKGKSAVPAFSFCVGLGAFPSDRGNNITAEESSQFVFMNFSQSKKEFFDDMIDLAGSLAEMMNQESTLLELSEKGSVALYEYIEAKPHNWSEIGDVTKMLKENSYRIPEKVWKR